jgi:diaminopimelate decarboxylase
VPVPAIAEGAGTPAYVYNAEVIRRQYRALDQAFAAVPHRLAYAVKANANLAVLRILRDLGAGADIVSGGELARALAAGFSPDRIVFSGVGKSDDELAAAVDAGIGHIHLESAAELAALGSIAAARQRRTRVGIRVNPDVTQSAPTRTHPQPCNEPPRKGPPQSIASLVIDEEASLGILKKGRSWFPQDAADFNRDSSITTGVLVRMLCGSCAAI